MDSQSSKSQRMLSCSTCQQRKVKCDKNIPCANCVKSQRQCIPATQAPRRRKLRFPERALLERLNKYEDLLRQNKIEFESVRDESVREWEAAKPITGSDLDGERVDAGERLASSPPVTIKSERSHEPKYELRRSI